MPAFVAHPQEGAIIGSLVVGYGELEILLALLVRWIIDDQDFAFRTLYGQRGESARITTAKTITFISLRHHQKRQEFEDMIDALRHCLKIRNQYAHGNWLQTPHAISFANVENICQQQDKADLGKLTVQDVTLKKLRQQERYFVYVMQLIEYLIFSFQRERGAQSTFAPQAPPKVARPNL